LVEQPARPDDLGVGRSARFWSAVTTFTSRWASVMAAIVSSPSPGGCTTSTPSTSAVGSRPGSAVEHESHGRIQASRGHRCPYSFREASCRAWPIAPPASWPRPDHVGGVDHQHPNGVAPSHIAGWVTGLRCDSLI
jgi:hypothetical protein